MISKTILSIVTGILTFIGLMPSINQNLFFFGLWILGFIIVGIIWFYELLREWSQKLVLDKLNNESFQNEFFMGFISERKAIQEITDDNVVVSKIFSKEDLIDFLKFYLYIFVKKSKISLFGSKFLSSDELYELIDDDIQGKIKEELAYSQIYPLHCDWESGKDMENIDYNGKITFKILLKLDKKPVCSLQKKVLLYIVEKDLDGETTQKIIKNLLISAEGRGVIKSIMTESCRSFGNLFYIRYRYAEPPEKDPFR